MQWPGYNHLRIRNILFFFSSTGNPRTIQEIGHDIAYMYRSFIQVSAPEFSDSTLTACLQDNHAAFNPVEHNALRLGPGQVSFAHLRLLDIQFCDTTRECERWIADVSYVQS